MLEMTLIINMLEVCMDVSKNAVKDCQPTRNFLMDESVDHEVGRRIFRELFSFGVREIEIRGLLEKYPTVFFYANT